MTAGDRIRAFCSKQGLTQQEQDYLLGVLGEAVLSERLACASLAEGMAKAAALPGHPNADAREGMAAEIAAAIRTRKPSPGVEVAHRLIAAERERCRRVAQVWAEDAGILSWSGREVAEFIARDIEGGK